MILSSRLDVGEDGAVVVRQEHSAEVPSQIVSPFKNPSNQDRDIAIWMHIENNI